MELEQCLKYKNLQSQFPRSASADAKIAVQTPERLTLSAPRLLSALHVLSYMLQFRRILSILFLGEKLYGRIVLHVYRLCLKVGSEFVR